MGVGDAVVVDGDALDVVGPGVGLGAGLDVAAQMAPPTSPNNAASTMPPITQPSIERLGSSLFGPAGPPGAPGVGG